MNHDFIDALVELYEQLPDQTPDEAARRVAVLVDMEMEALESSGQPITRETLRASFEAAIKKHLSSAA